MVSLTVSALASVVDGAALFAALAVLPDCAWLDAGAGAEAVEPLVLAGAGGLAPGLAEPGWDAAGATAAGEAAGVGEAAGGALDAGFAWLWLDGEEGAAVGVGAGVLDAVFWGAVCGSAEFGPSSSEKKPPLSSPVADDVPVPDNSAVMVLLLWAVLVSDSILISAFQNASLFS